MEKIDFSKYIGIPFKEHGRDFRGVDCYGLLRLVLKEEFGVAIPSFTDDYENTTDGEHLGRLVKENLTPWREIKPGQERVGDGIILRLRNNPMHVGVVIGDGRMLHVEQGIETCIENYRDFRWAKRVIGFYRHELMTDEHCACRT